MTTRKSSALLTVAFLAALQVQAEEPSSGTEVAAIEPPANAAAAQGEPQPELPRARSIDLDEPVTDPAALPGEPPTIDEEAAAPDVAEDDLSRSGTPLVLLGVEVPAATATRLAWLPGASFEGISVPTPVLVVNGAKAGPTLCLTAALHGDELNGIEIVRRVMYNLEPDELNGAVIGVPIVNLQGFRRGSRYLPDRRDLNRYFPGNPTGSSAARIAYSFFNQVIVHCDALVDLHTGSFHRTNLPQLRADLSHPEVLALTQQFGATVALHSARRGNTLRQAAVDHGIPAVTLETGESMRLQEDAVDHGVRGIRSLLSNMGMLKRSGFWGQAEPAYYRSAWVRANSGGILFNKVDLGETVDEGDTLGTITDPITNVRSEILSPYDGRVLGMALNQVVLPGFAAYRIGIKSSQEEMSELPQGDETPAAPNPELEPDADPGMDPTPELIDADEDDDMAGLDVDAHLEASE
ncbi:MAG: hypothetical protein Hals2KO_35800 [Halioglobus sp.]